MFPIPARMDPFRRLLELQQSLASAFKTPDGPRTAHSHGENAVVGGTWQPLMDVFEDNDRIVVRLEVPGVPERDIDVRLDRNTLSISGERKMTTAGESDAHRLIEGTYGSFRRAFNLPDSVDGEHVTAESRDGVLSIRLPKLALSKGRQITVNAAAARIDESAVGKR
jgi:HSP20 family protein